MPKTGGDITKRRILDVSEKLFSEQGYDKTSIEEIAKNAKINKATIYFHFKNKNEIMTTLFMIIIEDLNKKIQTSFDKTDISEINLVEKIKMEIEFISKREKIITVMFMESLKKNNENNFLLKCAELVIEDEFHSAAAKKKHADRKMSKEEKQRFYVHEFFTGFIPFVVFIIFRKQWSDYFDIEDKKLFEYFIDSFKKSHLDSHMKLE